MKLKCVAMYQDMYMMTETTSSPPERTSQSLQFCPATFQSDLDILMDKLDRVNLTPLPVSHVFLG